MTTWRRLIRRVPLIRSDYLTELRRIRMNRRIVTLGTEFLATEVTLWGGFITVFYRERNNPTNWISISSEGAVIYLDGRYYFPH